MNTGTHQRGPAATKGIFSNRKFSVATLLYLATLGGAEVCDIHQTTGSFEPGKSFDALLVNTRSDNMGPAFEDEDAGLGKALEEHLEKFMFCGDDRNIQRVYVQGRLIGGTTYQE